MGRKRRRIRSRNIPFSKRIKRLSTPQLKKIYFGNKKQSKSQKCIYCGKKSTGYHVDHKNPIAKGGSNRKSNLVIACAACNSSKGDKRLPEWLRKIRSSKKSSRKTLYRKIIKHNKGKRSSIAKAIRRVRDSKNRA